MSAPMKVALYLRVSSEKQAEKDLSIPSQRKALQKYALDKGWEIVQEFVDEAQSARSAKRQDFQNMIALAKKKPPPFNVILVWKLSRFARSREDSIIYKALLRKNGVQLISINEQIDDSPAGKMLEGIIEVMDEFYSTNLAHDTVRGMKENAERGFFNGGYIPYGYELDLVKINGRTKRKWKINEEEAPVVRRMFELCHKGMGAKEIVKKFASEGIKNRKGKDWGKPNVYYILKNENYTGTYTWEREGEGVLRFSNHHPAIISKPTFDKAQEILLDRSPKQIHPRRVSSNYLLSGFLYCTTCGLRMKTVSANSGKQHYYVCPNFLNKGKHSCKNKGFNLKKAEDFIIEVIKDKILTEKNLKELVEVVHEELSMLKKNSKNNLGHIDKQLKIIDSKMKKLYESIETGKLDLDILAPRLNELQKNKNALLAEHSELKEQTEQDIELPKLSRAEVEVFVKDLRHLLSKSPVIEKKGFIKSFIKRINVNPPHAEIEYTIPMKPFKKEGPPQKTETLEVLPFNLNGSHWLTLLVP